MAGLTHDELAALRGPFLREHLISTRLAVRDRLAARPSIALRDEIAAADRVVSAAMREAIRTYEAILASHPIPAAPVEAIARIEPRRGPPPRVLVGARPVPPT